MPTLRCPANGRGCMWIPTETEAVEMFARQLVTRHRATASTRAREMAEALRRRGDVKGHRIWNAVADTADRLRQGNHQRHSGLAGSGALPTRSPAAPNVSRRQSP